MSEDIDNEVEIELDDDVLDLASGGFAVSSGTRINSAAPEHTEVFKPFDGSY